MNFGSSPEWMVGMLGATVLVAALIVQGVRWLLAGPLNPDPWDEEITQAMDNPDTPAICHRCLEPHSLDTDFCSRCGAPVGQYTNYLPLPYLYSVGDLLRTGTSGEYRRSPVASLGFILLALAEYTIFAPVYLFFLFRARTVHDPTPQPNPAP